MHLKFHKTKGYLDLSIIIFIQKKLFPVITPLIKKILKMIIKNYLNGLATGIKQSLN